MEEINPNSNIWEPVETTVNNEEEDDWDIKVDIPIPTPPPQLTLETLNNKLLTNNNTTYNVSDLMTTPNTDSGISKESTLRVEVPIPPTPTLELLTNKQLNNNQTYIVSNLMSDSTNNVGIYKDSSLVVNVSPYLPNNYKQTLNYVGYWKWDSTNQTFIQVLNNQDIIDEKYNLKIQPLFYDADTGLPQKVTVNSGDTKRLKMVNDNNDGSMEPTEYVENNNTMVRFNSKTRSITEYPYFEVEALPPTIISPITSNGYYKFDGNTLIPGTNQDYNIYINIQSLEPLYLSDITCTEFCDDGKVGNATRRMSGLLSNPIVYHYLNQNNDTITFNSRGKLLDNYDSSNVDCLVYINISKISNNNYLLKLNMINSVTTTSIKIYSNDCWIITYNSTPVSGATINYRNNININNYYNFTKSGDYFLSFSDVIDDVTQNQSNSR